MNQSFEARRARAVRLLAEKGVPRWKNAPAIYRLVWSCGIRLRPPHFASWEANFVFFGGILGVVTAVSSWLIITVVEGKHAVLRAAVSGIAFAVIYGFGKAARHKREAEDFGLPPWDELSDVAEVFD